MQYGYKTKEEVRQYLQSHGLQNKRIKKVIRKFASNISMVRRDKNVESMVLYGSKFEYLCRLLSEQYHVMTIDVIRGISRTEYWLNKRFSILYYQSYILDAANAFINEDDKKLEKLKREFIHYFKRIKPKFILAISISCTADRIMYDAARECRIPVVYMVHGFITNIAISESQRQENLFAKNFIDFYWFWNKKDQDIYIDQKFCREENSFVLGYPYKKMESKIPEKFSVLFVGEATEYNLEASIKCHKMANDIYLICKRMGIPFKYKKHPKEHREHIKKYLSPDICFVNDLFQEFRENQVVVGGRTSALIEAGFMGNYVVQIDYDHERVKNFIFEHCYLIKDWQVEFEPLMLKIKNKEIQPKSLSPYEFYQSEDLLSHFNKGVERIERYYGK